MKIKSICVFCGASKVNNSAYLNSARTLGIELATRQIRLIYGGGGSGLMGCLANSVIKSGGEVTGVIPHYLKNRELENRNLTKLEVVSDMHERKKRMFDLADGIVVLPGGIGTLEETFEVITWKQLGMHKKPIITTDPWLNDDEAYYGSWTLNFHIPDNIVSDIFQSEFSVPKIQLECLQK